MPVNRFEKESPPIYLDLNKKTLPAIRDTVLKKKSLIESKMIKKEILLEEQFNTSSSKHTS